MGIWTKLQFINFLSFLCFLLFVFFYPLKIKVELIYSIVSISAVQYSDPVIQIYICVCVYIYKYMYMAQELPLQFPDPAQCVKDSALLWAVM